MPESIGLVILSATGALEAGSGIAGLGTLAATTFAGVSLASAVGATALVAASIGLNAALNSSPSMPKPEDGAQPLKQAIPPRIRGYWDNRLAGYYMLFEAGGTGSQDVMAFHHGQIESILRVYLHDDHVDVSPAPGHGVQSNVVGFGTAYDTNAISLQFLYGLPSQPASVLLTTDPVINATWTTAFHGNGIAYVAMSCNGRSTPEAFTVTYPRGLPLLSVVARCSPVWDPRIPGQLRNDPTTWLAVANPVVQWIDYVTRADGGLGHDYDTVIAPNIEALKVQADRCDQLVSGEARYHSAGWYTFENNPEDILGKLLASCDGYQIESGDGTLSFTVGYYTEPVDPPLTDRQMFGFTVRYGVGDESLINQVIPTYTDPAQNYVSTQADAVRDEASIAIVGVKNQPLDLSWVQWPAQVDRLANRALLRLNPAVSGTLVCKLIAFRYLGKRWVKVQNPFVVGLEDAVIEIQSYSIDLLAGQITLQYITVDPAALLALQ